MSSIRGYLLKRVLEFFPALLGVLTIGFIISHVIPGDPVALAAGLRATPEVRESMRIALGFDKPLPVQWANYVAGFFLHFDLGKSLNTKNYVISDVFTFLPASIELVTTAMILVVLLSIPLGVFSATHKDKPVDHAARLFALGGVAIPDFWLGMMLQFLFAYILHWFPISGRIDPSFLPQHVTGLYLLDSLLTANWSSFVNAISHITLPAVVLALQAQTIITRMTRSSMLEELQKDYVRTSRAYGFAERTVVYRHVLKNALIPTTTHFGIAFGGLFAYTVIIEKVFDFPGIGLYVANAVLLLDFPAIIGGMLFLAIIVIATNLVIDLIYLAIDPRIKYR